MVARIGSRFATASSSLFRTTTPTPSPRQYPSAPLSKVLHDPVWERKLPLLRPEYMLHPLRIFDPPATAMLQSRLSKEEQASWIASKLEEQALSTLYEGPSHLKW